MREMSVGEMLSESGRTSGTANALGVTPDIVSSPWVPDVGKTGAGLMGLQMGETQAVGGIWDKIVGFADKNPTAASMFGKGALDFGATLFKDDAAGDASKMALAELYGVRAETERQQTANANYVPSVASKFASTPGLTPFKTTTPSYIAPRMSGGLMTR
jgi:hypothetical protein